MSRERYRDWKDDGGIEYAEAGDEQTVLRLVDDSSSWGGDLDQDRFEADLKKRWKPPPIRRLESTWLDKVEAGIISRPF